MSKAKKRAQNKQETPLVKVLVYLFTALSIVFLSLTYVYYY